MSIGADESGIDYPYTGPSAAGALDDDRADNPTHSEFASVGPPFASLEMAGSTSSRPTAPGAEAEGEGAFRLQELLDRTRKLQGTTSS